MKKILCLFSILPVFAIMLTSCGGSGAGLGPKEVLVSFFEKLSQKDLDGAAKLATKDSKSTIDMMKKAFEAADKMKRDNPAENEKDPAEEFKNMEIGDAKISGDAATVPVKNKKEEREFEFPLKKEDGDWKVDFSMATLMKMGMEERKRQGAESVPNLNDYDSTTVRKSMEMADSVLKNMDPEKLKQMQKAMEQLKRQKD